MPGWFRRLGGEYDDPAEAAFMSTRRTAHPILCFREAVHLTHALEDYAFSRTCIRATADRADAPSTTVFDAAAQRARESAARRCREVATNHMVASNRPQELAALLRELARARRAAVDDVTRRARDELVDGPRGSCPRPEARR